MVAEILNAAASKMQKSLDSLKIELAKIRTGRATPSLLDSVQVVYYGTETPLHQLASVTTDDARTLAVTPWDKALIPAIEKAIMSSGLGLNPVTVGTVIRVPMPALTEERRKDLVKVVKQEVETAKVAVRNIRREANTKLKDLLKSKSITEDDERESQSKIQKLTDDKIKETEVIMSHKEKELLEV